jgi:hypothetical protein
VVEEVALATVSKPGETEDVLVRLTGFRHAELDFVPQSRGLLNHHQRIR